jgi:N-acetyl-S-(2-succino)cysteine monooxygenase
MNAIDTLPAAETAVPQARRMIVGLHIGMARRSAALAEPHVSVGESVRITQLAEVANFDMVFRGDFIQFRREALNPLRPSFAMDPLVELTALATATSRIGLVSTLSTTFNVPYILARQLQTLDNVARGRVGWNAVTSFDGEGHFGLTELPQQEERYARASEFLDVLHALWSSWTPGAVYVDEGGQVRVDKSRIRDVDYRGRHHSSRGGLGVPRSRQGWPVQFQAGASAHGIAFAGKYAEAIYAASPTDQHARGFYDKIHDAAKTAGRDQAPIILPGMRFTLARTKEKAIAKYKAANASINYATAIKALEGQLGHVRLEGLPLDEPVPKELFAEAGVDERRRISRPALYRELVEQGRTLREIVEIYSVGNSHHIFVGSYDEAAEHMHRWWTERLSDGFLVGFYGDERGLEKFIERVLPQLDTLRVPVGADVTLRERLGLPYPQ